MRFQRFCSVCPLQIHLVAVRLALKHFGWWASLKYPGVGRNVDSTRFATQLSNGPFLMITLYSPFWHYLTMTCHICFSNRIPKFQYYIHNKILHSHCSSFTGSQNALIRKLHSTFTLPSFSTDSPLRRLSAPKWLLVTTRMLSHFHEIPSSQHRGVDPQ